MDYIPRSEDHRVALLEAALSYASAGWPVLPLRTGRKVPATPHGCLDATTDLEFIRFRWEHVPWNVGIATGAPGPDVLDFDSYHDRQRADNAFAKLRDLGLLAGAHAKVTTRTGGFHLYYAGTDQRCRTGIGSYPVDFRGRGGYVVAPPSYVEPGWYEFEGRRESTGKTLDVAKVSSVLAPPAPRPVSNLVRPSRSSADGLLRGVASAPEGMRNAYLFWAACRAVEDGLMDAATVEAFVDAARQCGLPEWEARRTVESARRHAEVAA